MGFGSVRWSPRSLPRGEGAGADVWVGVAVCPPVLGRVWWSGLVVGFIFCE